MLDDIKKDFFKLIEKFSKNKNYEIHHATSSAYFARILSLKRKVNSFNAEIAALIHDIGRITAGKHEEHGKLGYEKALEFLEKYDIPKNIKEEIALSVKLHTDKKNIFSPLSEIIKDSEILASSSERKMLKTKEHILRLIKIKKELNLPMTKITFLSENILKQSGDIIVNPANSKGEMGGGLALKIKKSGGEIIEKEAIKQSKNLSPGKVIKTTAGNLDFKYVFHAATMKEPVEKAKEHVIKEAVINSLVLAESVNAENIYFPGLGTGVGKIPYEKAAKIMVYSVLSQLLSVERIIFCDINENFIKESKKIYNDFLEALC
jgi:O-acetyl-ADP-ribose deacetylase (regulator of RNase III)